MALFAGELNEVAPKRPVDVCRRDVHLSAFPERRDIRADAERSVRRLSTSTEVALAYALAAVQSGRRQLQRLQCGERWRLRAVIPNNRLLLSDHPDVRCRHVLLISSPDACRVHG